MPKLQCLFASLTPDIDPAANMQLAKAPDLTYFDKERRTRYEEMQKPPFSFLIPRTDYSGTCRLRIRSDRPHILSLTDDNRTLRY